MDSSNESKISLIAIIVAIIIGVVLQIVFKLPIIVSVVVAILLGILVGFIVYIIQSTLNKRKKVKVKWSKETLNFKGKVQMASLKLDYP